MNVAATYRYGLRHWTYVMGRMLPGFKKVPLSSAEEGKNREQLRGLGKLRPNIYLRKFGITLLPAVVCHGLAYQSP